MTDPIHHARHTVEIVGDINVKRLAQATEPQEVYERQKAADDAVREVVNCDLTDFYLMEVRNGDSVAVTRTFGMAFGVSGMWLPTYSGPETSSLSAWIGHGERPPVQVSEDPETPASTPYSAVIAGLLFRQLWGPGPRTFDLGPSWGFVEFTPRRMLVPWFSGAAGRADLARHEFAYDAVTASNYVRTASGGSGYGVWLWFTDPRTGEAGADVWKVSHVVDAVTDPVDARLDDPAQPPPRRPPLLKIDNGAF